MDEQDAIFDDRPDGPQAAAPDETPPSRPARRSVWVLALLALGMLAARWIYDCSPLPVPSWMCLAAGAALALAGGLARGRWCKSLLAAAVVMLGMGWWTMRIAEAPGHGLARLLTAATAVTDQPLVTAVEGVVLDAPERPSATARTHGALAAYALGAAQPAATRFRVRVSRVALGEGMLQTSGEVRVFIGGALPAALRAGDRVRLVGELEPIDAPIMPGQPDARLFAAQDGLAGRLHVDSAGMVQQLDTAHASLGERLLIARVRLLDAARQRTRRALGLINDEQPHEPHAGAALLGALLLGERDAALHEVSAAFQRLGLVHLVAISGFNMVVLAGVGLWLLRLTGDRGWVEPTLVAAMIGGYLLILPVSAPVLRAGLMVLALLAAEAAGRRYDRLSVMGWIGVGLLLWRPMDAWSLGFQLSFGIVAALLWLGEGWRNRLFTPPLKGTLPDPVGDRTAFEIVTRRMRRRGVEALKDMLTSSLLAWAVALPIVAQHIGVVTPLAVLTTILVLPLTTLVMVAGYIVLIIGTLWPPAGAACAAWLSHLSESLVWIVMTLDHVPGLTLRVPHLSAIWAACTLVVILWWIHGFGGTDLQIGAQLQDDAQRNSRRRLARLGALPLATLIVTAWLGIQLWRSTPHGGCGLAADTRVRIDTLAVGDGTCHLVRVRADDGRAGAILWDCGSLWPGIGVRRVPDAVRALGVWRIRDAVITHADFDHYAGLLDVVEPLGIQRVWLTHAFLQSAQTREGRGGEAASALLDGLHARGVEIRQLAAGDVLPIIHHNNTESSAWLRVLWPPPGDAWQAAFDSLGTPKDDNDASLVARLELRSADNTPPTAAALFTADLGPWGCRRLIEGDDPLAAVWMEAPHHGSVQPEALALVRLVDPRVVAQSTGPRRAGDPRWDDLRRGRTWLTTATDGSVWFELLDTGATRTGTMNK